MNAPTLLVGLGGSGSDIVQKVYHLATPKQRENIAFVIFDTDVNELRVIEEKTPQIRTVQISTRLTVGEYLDCDRYSRDTWFPVNRILNGKALTEGAGQVRAVSRLAMNTAIQQGKMAPLTEAIESLYRLKGQRTVQAPRVILVGSLCGGTGSGLIMPAAMFIRNFMTTKLQQGTAIIRGFFLLPEVFNGVIKTQSERNNLRSNAYAAVREIDAFMMKDDGSLPKQYDIHFMAPRPGSREQDEYTGRPMDFCFLFDAQNLNGMKLNSFAEYKDHAANCIYGMAIAPTSQRSNSSEDNVIREIVYAGGRNRFAGAGSSMLIYPTDDVRRYLALTWTKETISDEWLEVDRQFAEQQKSTREMRRKGVPVEEMNRGKHYVEVVNQGFVAQKPFASAIRNLCVEFSPNGFSETGIKWTQYVEALTAYLDQNIEDKKEDLAELLDTLERKSAVATNKSASEDGYTDWYSQLLAFKTATIKCTSSMTRNLVYSLFREAKDCAKTQDRFRIEYWLHKDQNPDEFIHPNAVRYFLYNAREALHQMQVENSADMKEIEEFWTNFEKSTFDMPGTDRVETKDEFFAASHLNDESFKRFMNRGAINEARAKLNDNFSLLKSKTEAYWQAYVYNNVCLEAVAYIDELSKAFHEFYDVLDRNIAKLDKEIQQLEQKYRVCPGEALRYVCADADCLKGLSGEVINLSSCLEIPSELNRRIFNQMKMYALSEQKPEAESYFTETFNNTVVEYLKEEIQSHYGSLVGMDVISALEKEAYYKDPKGNYDLDDQRLYARNVIESTRILAKPFIESPIGKEPRVIEACAYHPDLAKADFPNRKAFVAAYLKDGGGVEDESIERDSILFYQSVYDLRANELSKFAPPRQTETFERTGGEYYTAYHELIRQIHPETQKSKAITPHIDRWWHVITKMPDLDEKSQQNQENEICTAFFWGMLAEYVHLGKESATSCVYQPDQNALHITEEGDEMNLIVSNGTPCDHLYEVMDAFAIYPRLVQAVLEKIHSCIDGDLYDKVPLKKSILCTLLENFRIEEYELIGPDGKALTRSIFALPLLMKKSVPAEEYYEASMIRLVETMLQEIREYVSRFCNKKEAPGAYIEILQTQYERFIKNVALDLERFDDIYNDSLFVYICKAVAREFENNHLREEALHVQQLLRELSRQE